MDNRQNRHYVTGLDGLRAMAIFFIAAYHFSFNWASGGFLGVDVFFVLSGYLVTLKLLSLHNNSSKINLKKFWCERIIRLLPAAYLVIIAAVVWAILFNNELFNTLWGDAVSSMSYATNWWFIFHKLSYFDSFGSPSPLKHLWYLSVQEQFFFIWPIMLMAGLKFFKKRNRFSFIVFTLALCSALLMGIMYNPESDPSRIYYGTDTRSFDLLIGSLLALILPIEKLSSKETSLKQRYVLNISGIISLTIFIICAIFTNEFHSFLYRGGMFLFSLNSALLIACICHPGGLLGPVLSWKPLRWLGTRSFQIYLWHYPIMVLSTPVYEIGNPVYWHVALQLAVTCIVAELSYLFVEMPIRKLGFREFYRKYLYFNIFNWSRSTMANKISAIFVIILAVGINGFIKNANKVETVESYPTEIVESSGEELVPQKDFKISYSDKYGGSSDMQDNLNSPEKNISGSDKKNEISSQALNKTYKATLAIGDSLMLDIAPYLKKKISNITINGKVSRQMTDALKLVPSYKGFNSDDKAVIIELGTNGYFTDKQIDSLLDSFSSAHVYLINTRVPRRWEATVNKILRQKAGERENVTLVDWYSLAIKHPEFFGRDGVHLKASGSEALTNLINQAMSSK